MICMHGCRKMIGATGWRGAVTFKGTHTIRTNLTCVVTYMYIYMYFQPLIGENDILFKISAFSYICRYFKICIVIELRNHSSA